MDQVHSPLIWYGIQGEGRGHATRSMTLVQALRKSGFSVRIFSGGDALDVLGQDPTLSIIPLLRFHQRQGKISLPRTLLANLPFFLNFIEGSNGVLEQFDGFCKDQTPDLVISDFEPLLALWARRRRVPWMSIDHQHALSDNILPRANFRARWEGALMGKMVEFLLPSRNRVISSFHHFPLRPGSEALLVGCFLRPEIVQATRSDRGHICVYLKSTHLLGRIAAIATSRPSWQFEIWSENVVPMPENARLCLHHPTAFAKSLASCHWLLTTAGNQLLGEAISLEKPILAIPTPGQTEQIFNALALVDSGCGDWCTQNEFTANRIEQFLARRPEWIKACHNRNQRPSQVDGTSAALEAIKSLLGR